MAWYLVKHRDSFTFYLTLRNFNFTLCFIRELNLVSHITGRTQIKDV